MYRYIDLSRRINNLTPAYPGDFPAKIMPGGTYDENGYVASTLKMGLHTGTHIDFPQHFYPGGRAAADFSLESFAGRGIMLDVRGEKLISFKEDFSKRIKKGDVVLFFTGAEEYFGQDRYFEDHPAIERRLIALLSETGVRMVGFDTPEPDLSPFYAHRKLLESGIPIIENLCGLEALLEEEKFEVFAMPLRIEAEASPARVFARIRLK